MNELLARWVEKIPNIVGYESTITTVISSVFVIFLAIVAYVIAHRVIVHLIHKFLTKTESDLDDILVKRKVFQRIAYLAPSYVIYKLMPAVLTNYPTLASVVSTITAVYFVFVITLVIDSILDSFMDIYRSFPISRRIPISSFGQVAKLIIYFIAVITIASLIIGESPIKLFAGLGAMTAVLMLVFKDPILGFVAGIQLSYNKMVGLGDWVEIPQHNADGDILEIGLTTVKVRNFDNTITTVPTQSLINESFKNWRGMQESRGRRIKRAIYIDINSITFCNEERLLRYSKIDYINDYIESKKQELDEYNAEHIGNEESLVNGRRITNIGTFRAYILAYLRNNKYINKDLTLLVRQLAPTDAGLPLEIYTFSSEKNWIKYEAIQADIFDHLFAVAREFDLRIFQQPTGADFKNIID